MNFECFAEREERKGKKPPPHFVLVEAREEERERGKGRMWPAAPSCVCKEKEKRKKRDSYSGPCASDRKRGGGRLGGGEGAEYFWEKKRGG